MATILIVDDHSLHRHFLLALLEGSGHRLLEASDGLEALRLATGEHPDLIVTDIMMPHMDGYQLVQRLRLEPALAATPVVFYTSTYSTAEAAAMARDCGVRWVLPKPAAPQLILRTLYEALGMAAPATTPVAAPPDYRYTALDQAMLHSLRDAGILHDAGHGAGELAPHEPCIMDVQALSMRLTALIDMGIELASQRNPRHLIEAGCRIARHVGVARYAVVAILAPDGLHYTHFTTRGMEPGMQEMLAGAPPPNAGFSLALAQRRVLRLHGLRGGALNPGLPPGHPPLDSLLVAPIASPEQVYGWIHLGDKLGADRFGDIDQEVLVAVAAQIAVAYENVQLLERIGQNLAMLEKENAERRKLGEQLQESEAQFRQLTENIDEVFFLMNAEDGRFLYVSPAYERILGRSRASLYEDPRSWTESIHPDDRARVLGMEDERKQTRELSFDYSYRLLQPSGAVRFIHTRGFPIEDAQGRVYRVAGISEDVSDITHIMNALREREAGLRRAQKISRLAHVVSLPDGRFDHWSSTLPELLGVDDAQVPATTVDWLNLVHPDDRKAVRRCATEAARTGKHQEIAYRMRHADQRWIQLHQVLEPLPGTPAADGGQRWFNTIQDVTEQREQQAKLARLSRIYAVQSGINSAIVRIHEREALLRAASRVAVEQGAFSMAGMGLIGERSADGRIIRWLHGPAGHDQDELLLRAAVEIGVTHPACRAARELRTVVCNDISAEPALATLSVALDGAGHRALVALPLLVDQKVVAVITLYTGDAGFFDKEELTLLDEMAADLSFGLNFIAKEEQLNFLAYHDALTGLPNRPLFLDRVNQRLAGREPAAGAACVVLINLDRFGQLNDALGRNGGDAVLRLVGQRLTAALPESASVARIVADTYALVLDGLGDETGAAVLVETLVLDPVEQEFNLAERTLRVSACAGISLYPADGTDAETLLKCAEVALKNAKSSVDRVLYYAPRMNAANAARLELEGALRVALESRQFVLHYQPRVDLVSGRVVSAEALVRWQHPHRGLVGPVQFIPLCEETGLIVPLGAWIIDAVCAQQVQWRRDGVEIVPVAVNLSALQFRKGQLMQTIAEATARHGLEQQYLEFELTESLVMDDIERAIVQLQALRDIGAKLSLDDFGTGYSSLAYLQRLPFDYVKIDRSFVTNITSQPSDAAIVAAVIAVAHSLKLEVVAEGVETEGQLRQLQRLRCDQLQGYLFSPGVDAVTFRAMLVEDKRLAYAALPNGTRHSVLVVDDEANILSALARALRREDYRVLTAGGGPQALELLACNEVQVIVSDQRMPGMSGTEFLAIVKDLYPDTIRIILSGHTDLEVVTNSVNRGAVFKFLTKPWDDDLLRSHIREAFRMYGARQG